MRGVTSLLGSHRFVSDLARNINFAPLQQLTAAMPEARSQEGVRLNRRIADRIVAERRPASEGGRGAFVSRDDVCRRVPELLELSEPARHELLSSILF